MKSYAKMQKGLDDMRNGRITPLDDVYAELSKAISEIKNGAQELMPKNSSRD